VRNRRALSTAHAPNGNYGISMHLRLATALLFVGSLMFGLGFCASEPPFEGFDEPAHFSYIQQVAETGTRPRMTDPLSADVEDYLRLAPGPASYEGRSYKQFFGAPPETIRAVAAAVHEPRDPSRGWRIGSGHNWAGQHPPLYYVLLAPAYSLSKSWSLDNQLIALRAFSFVLAWAGLVIAVFSAWRPSEKSPARALVVLAPALWPALIPMWFPEMARLGNDSLVLFLAALVVVALRRVLSPEAKFFDAIALGGLCGLGLLTKATFLPVVAGLGLVLLYRVWKTRRDPAPRRSAMRALILFSLAALAVAGWWYVKSVIDTGSIVVSHDDHLLAEKGGWAKNLPEHVSWGDVLGNIAAIAVTFVWSGTWSLIPTPLRTLVPIFMLLVALGSAWIWRLRRLTELEVFALLVLAFFIVGLLQANLVNIAVNGMFAIPAWYLHSLVPIFAPLLGYALVQAAGWRTARPLMVGLLLYPLVFLLFATAWLLSWYAGCFDRPDGPLQLSSALACGLGPAALIERLAHVANPALAIPLLLAGWSMMVVATVVIVRRSFRPPPVAS
jgi:4-amino-4-deoxy-L-arabinose transferase-like glycosyltransferase